MKFATYCKHEVSCQVRGLNFGSSLHLHPELVNTSSDGSGDSCAQTPISLLDHAISTKHVCASSNFQPKIPNVYLCLFLFTQMVSSGWKCLIRALAHQNEQSHQSPRCSHIIAWWKVDTQTKIELSPYCCKRSG